MLFRRVGWTLAALGIASMIAVALSSVAKQSIAAGVMNFLTGNFRDETAQVRFMSYATTISPLKRLELAKLEQVEVFDRSSQATIFWKTLALPEVVVRATLPVEYRYYVDLNDQWRVVFDGRTLFVTAPAPSPGTPSPNISELRYEVRKGSLFRSENAVAKALSLELTSLLKKRAQDNLALVRETARKQIAEIGTQWLSSESKHAQIVVRFTDERELDTSHK